MIKQIDDYNKATNLLVEAFILKYFGGDENSFTWYKWVNGKMTQCKVSEGINFKVTDGDGGETTGYWSGGRLTIDETYNYTIDEMKLALELDV